MLRTKTLKSFMLLRMKKKANVACLVLVKDSKYKAASLTQQYDGFTRSHHFI
jgi:hypothetical protein